MYKFEDILAKAAVDDSFEIQIEENDLVFLVRNHQNSLVANLIALMPEDRAVIKLPKLYDLSIKEDLGMRSDRLLNSRRLELTAMIGDELGISEELATGVLTDPQKWDKLSDELKGQISQFMVGFFAEDAGESSLPARRMTTILQERLTPSWRIEWTLALPRSIADQIVEYIEGEMSHWRAIAEEESTIEVEVKGKRGKQNIEKQLEPSETV
jgi:hypothetical protein